MLIRIGGRARLAGHLRCIAANAGQIQAGIRNGEFRAHHLQNALKLPFGKKGLCQICGDAMIAGLRSMSDLQMTNSDLPIARTTVKHPEHGVQRRQIAAFGKCLLGDAASLRDAAALGQGERLANCRHGVRIEFGSGFAGHCATKPIGPLAGKLTRKKRGRRLVAVAPSR